MRLLDNYQHKIKSAEELSEILGNFPREGKVVMCHGVFDVVHPGHIRHLMYAKSKGKILIASITADLHIQKGKFRPHVPQELRALNLAALEAVDYVLIDKNSTPLKNISIIQPDIFAKGYEYVAEGKPVKTLEEENLLASYGAEVLFTPGDIVYSSSALITKSPPEIKIEKLLSLLNSRNISLTDVISALDGIKNTKVHIIGDTIVDSYTQTTMIGAQNKTPTISVRFDKRQDFIGGAAIVAKHLCTAGADVTFTTVLGDDSHKDFVLEDLKQSGVKVNAIVDSKRPTTNKNAIVANNYRLLKVDTLDNSSISNHVLAQITANIKSIPTDAVIFSDFRHGIFNRQTIPDLIDAIPEGVFKAADSQVASRWGNVADFEGFDLITPNEREARFAVGDQDSGVRPLASELYDRAKCKTLILKLGENGIYTCSSSDHESINSFFVIDSFKDKLVDAVGAGDALLAYSTLLLANQYSPVIASLVGCLAASCECEFDGNIPISKELIINKIKSIEKAITYQNISIQQQQLEFA